MKDRHKIAAWQTRVLKQIVIQFFDLEKVVSMSDLVFDRLQINAPLELLFDFGLELHLAKALTPRFHVDLVVPELNVPAVLEDGRHKLAVAADVHGPDVFFHLNTVYQLPGHDFENAHSPILTRHEDEFVVGREKRLVHGRAQLEVSGLFEFVRVPDLNGKVLKYYHEQVRIV